MLHFSFPNTEHLIKPSFSNQVGIVFNHFGIILRSLRHHVTIIQETGFGRARTQILGIRPRGVPLDVESPVRAPRCGFGGEVVPWSHFPLPFGGLWGHRVCVQRLLGAFAGTAGGTRAAAGATGHSCNAPGRCCWCCWSHMVILQSSWALLLVLQEPQELLLEPQGAPAKLLGAVAGAAGATGRSCKGSWALLRVLHDLFPIFFC